ncbi:MAG TPA: hypothetical protein VK525_15040 [Candidatus Saccharimonadales bacterium]|nr:hypothetical protein [Candidatus Saccharimonadales bacterium]
MDHEKVAEQASRVLLAPMYLIYDLTTGLLPGLLFVTLIFIKHSHIPFELLSNPVLGYKVRIGLGMFVSYIVGRVFRTIVESVGAHYLKKQIDALKDKMSGPDVLGSLFIGALALPKLFKKIHPLDMLVLVLSNAVFTFTTSLVLITASVIPGDGPLRAVELCSGFVMLYSGILTGKQFMPTFIFLLGGMIDLPAMFGPLSKIFASFQNQSVPPQPPKPPQTPEPPQGSAT